MFQLIIKDSNGIALNEGDIVKVTGNYSAHFYCEVTYLDNEKALAPFHTFSFHTIVKVDRLPANAVKGMEDRYNMWYVSADAKDIEKLNKYVASWRDCERLIDKGCFHIEKENA